MNSGIKRVLNVDSYMLNGCYSIVDQTRPGEAVKLFKSLREDVENKKHVMFVFDGASAPMGFIKGRVFNYIFDIKTGKTSLQTEIDYLFVDKKYQGAGVADMLLKAYEKYCIENGVEKISLKSMPTKQALGFYAKNGYAKANGSMLMTKFVRSALKQKQL